MTPGWHRDVVERQLALRQRVASSEKGTIQIHVISLAKVLIAPSFVWWVDKTSEGSESNAASI